MAFLFSMIFFIGAYYFWPEKAYYYLPFYQWNLKILEEIITSYTIVLCFIYAGAKLLVYGLKNDRIFRKWTIRYFMSLLIKIIGIITLWAAVLFILLHMESNYKFHDYIYYIEIIIFFMGIVNTIGLLAFSEYEVVDYIYKNLNGLIPVKYHPKLKEWLSLP
jgi:hypothetical protein